MKSNLLLTETASHHCPEYLSSNTHTGTSICLLDRTRSSSSRSCARGLGISYRGRVCYWDGIPPSRCIWEVWLHALGYGEGTFHDRLFEVFEVVILKHGRTEQSSHSILIDKYY